jgi:hypothetical protein
MRPDLHAFQNNDIGPDPNLIPDRDRLSIGFVRPIHHDRMQIAIDGLEISGNGTIPSNGDPRLRQDDAHRIDVREIADGQATIDIYPASPGYPYIITRLETPIPADDELPTGPVVQSQLVGEDAYHADSFTGNRACHPDPDPVGEINTFPGQQRPRQTQRIVDPFIRLCQIRDQVIDPVPLCICLL